jgi:hypothetical protein
MKSAVKYVLIIGAVAFGATAASAAAPQAQSPQQTPKGWSYDLKNGQRVPKGNRVTNADGSWREELKQGNCTTVKEKSANGEYKESRQCGSASPN